MGVRVVKSENQSLISLTKRFKCTPVVREDEATTGVVDLGITQCVCWLLGYSVMSSVEYHRPATMQPMIFARTAMHVCQVYESAPDTIRRKRRVSQL